MTGIALPTAGDRFRLQPGGEPGHVEIARIETGEVIGCARLEEHEGTVHIAALVVETPHRRYGAGSESAALLIDGLVAGGAKRVTAWAPPNVGLAAYFWFRMGLHALHGPGPGGGILYELHQSQTV